jgi:hypothetical protein
MELTENQSVRFGVRMAFKARGPGVVNGILQLVVTHEPFESPSSRAFVEARIFDHHVDPSAFAFEDDPVLLLGFAQFVHNYRAIGEVAGRIALGCLLIRKNVVHSLFALWKRTAG